MLRFFRHRRTRGCYRLICGERVRRYCKLETVVYIQCEGERLGLVKRSRLALLSQGLLHTFSKRNTVHPQYT